MPFTPSAMRQLSDLENRMLIAAVKENVPEAESVRDGLATAVKKLNRAKWGDMRYTSASELQCKAAVGVPCKVRGYVETMSRVTPVHFSGELVDTVALSIRDSAGDSIQSTTVANDELIRRVIQKFHAQQTVEFAGCAVLVPTYNRAKSFTGLQYMFLLGDIARSGDALQMILATPEEIKNAEKLVKRLSRTEGGIIEYIRSQLVSLIGIRGLDKSPLLDRSLSAVVLQALSDGFDPSRSISHKIHTMVIGSPAVGKKLLAVAIRILNPACTEAHPGKVTIPGIAGRAYLKNGAWKSEPGLIPLADGGTFLIQDFHHVAAERKRDVMGVLSLTMEDGKIIDSSSAKQTHRALTAIHLDLNKHSDVYLGESDEPATGHSRLTDLGVSMNVLTRFDFITEIPRDTARQLEIALAMHSGAQRTGPYPERHENHGAERELKVLVAYLRSKFAEVEIPADIVEKHIRVKQQELLDRNRDRLEQLKLLGDYQTRLSNSVHKFVFAIARGNARSVANAGDVDGAFRFIATKMEFLATIEPFETPKSWHNAAQVNKVDERQRFIRYDFAGMDVTPETVLPRVRERFGSKVSVSTVRRDLNKVAAKPAHGTFRVPERQNENLKKSKR